MIATFSLYIWLLLNLFAVFFISKKNASFGLFPNLTLFTFVIIYLIPMFFDRQVSDEFIFSVIFANATLLIMFFLFSIKKHNQASMGIGATNRKTLSIGSLSVIAAVVFCTIGNFATYFSLINSGGLFSVISDFGGRGYLSARVNNEGSGILGLLAWSSPFSLAFIFAAALTRRKKLYWVLFFSFFIITAIGYALLTVRHNMVAMLLMLSVTYMTFRKPSIKLLFAFFITSLSVLVYFQSLRVSGIDGLALDAAIESTYASNEHIWVTEHVIEEAEKTGFTLFSHASDIFVFAIPRAIWPAKPKTSELNRTFFPEIAAMGSEKSVGLVAEGYASLGLVGVFIITAIFALMIVRLQLHLNRTYMKPKSVFVAIALAPLCYIGVRTGFLGKHLISFIFIYFQYLIFMKLAKYNLVLKSRSAGN